MRQSLQAQTTCAVCTWSQQTSAFTLCRPSLYSAAQTTLLGCTLWLPHKPLAPGALAYASGPPSPHRYSYMHDFGTSLPPGDETRHRPAPQIPNLQQARLAQSAERKALNLVVVGSSPTVGAMCARHCRHRRPALSAHGLSRPQPSHSAAQVSIPRRKPLCWAAHSGCRTNRSRPGHLHMPAVLLRPIDIAICMTLGLLCPPETKRATDLRRRFRICNKPA